MGIALAFVAWGAFGPRPKMPSEEQIQREMERFQH
jgi:hypothetical protein